MFFRLSFHTGLFLICLLSQCSTVRQKGAPDRMGAGQHIFIDSLATPRPLALSTGDTNRDGLPDLLAGSAIYLNPGGDLTGIWKRISVGIDAQSLVLANINNDGNPDLLALAPPDLYWLEALDPEGIQWASIKVASMPFSVLEDLNGLVYEASREVWAIAGKDSLYLIQVPVDPEIEEWPVSPQPLGSGLKQQGSVNRSEADLDGDGDDDAVILKEGNIYILRNDQKSGKTQNQ